MSVIRKLVRNLKYSIINFLQFMLKHLKPKQYIVVESFFGAKKDENIEQIVDNLNDYKVYYVVKKGYKTNKNQLTKYSFSYFVKIARAKIVLTNSRVHNSIIHKNQNQIIIQFWHGTPWKKLVFDQTDINFSNQTKEKYLQLFSRDVAKWDYLVVSSKENEERLCSAFRYSGKLIRMEYPADVAVKKENTLSIQQKLKEEYKIKNNEKIILYMPTFREYAKNDEKYEFIDPLNILKTAAKYPNIKFLVRQHYLVQSKINQPENVIDVQNARLVDLYVIADLLITDYSSAIYSFAKLAKPIVSIQPDLETYISKRGLYDNAILGMNIVISKSIDEIDLNNINSLAKAQSNEHSHTESIDEILGIVKRELV